MTFDQVVLMITKYILFDVTYSI